MMRVVPRMTLGLILLASALAMAAGTTQAVAVGVEPQDCTAVTSVEELEQRALVIRAAYAVGDPQETALKEELLQGILRVTAPPYNADPTGVGDSTDAIQAAVCDARDARAICFFPPGTYRISKQIRCVRPAATLKSDGKGSYKNGRDYPSALVGSREGARPTIVLTDGAAGFGDTANPKAMIYFWCVYYKDGPAEPDKEQPGNSMEYRFEYLKLVTGANPGAVGVYFYVAQQSTMEDVEIDVSGGFAGINGLAGGGGSIHGLQITNGQYGLYTLGAASQPLPLVVGVVLTGQTAANVYNDCSGALTLVGCEMSGPGVVCDTSWDVGTYRAHLNLIDCRIDLAPAGGTAIWSERNVYLNNVWVQNAARIVEFDTGQTAPGNPSGWAHVAEYAGGSGSVANVTFRYHDGTQTAADLASVDLAPDGGPPTDFVSRHLPASIPSFTDALVANVQDFGAVGDGAADDATAIQNAINAAENVFIPKGVYKVSRPLQLRANTRLFGVHQRYSTVAADPASSYFNNAASPNLVIDTPDDAHASTSLSRLWVNSRMGAVGAYAIRWRVGRDSQVCDIKCEYREFESDIEPPGSRAFPLVLIQGGGGGRWYTLSNLSGASSLAPEFCMFRAEGTSEPLLFYHLNGEGAAYPRVNAEFLNARNFFVYGFKHEESAVAIRCINCRDFRVFGHGGVGGGDTAGQEVYRLENCDDFILTNLALQSNDMTPRNWNMLEEAPPGGGAEVDVAGEKRVLYYKRGEPFPLPPADSKAADSWAQY